MKKNILTIILLFISINVNCQTDISGYFNGDWTYCDKPSDERSLKIYDLGLICIKQNKHLGTASQIFHDLIKKDSTFCDAYFLAGYTFRMSNMIREAVGYYYIADSLSQNKSIVFKQNLATTFMLAGATELARKKFEEITTYFPKSSEGYYGIALTATEIGDFKNGLDNINTAIEKYKSENKDALFLKAVLLTLNSKHQESLKYYERVKGTFRKDDNFNGNYALSLYEVATTNNDANMMKLAKKHYEKVKIKEELTEQMRNKFEN